MNNKTHQGRADYFLKQGMSCYKRWTLKLKMQKKLNPNVIMQILVIVAQESAL